MTNSIKGMGTNLNLLTPQNGQTHSSKSSPMAEIFEGSERCLQIRAQILNDSETLNYMKTLQQASFKNNNLFQQEF